MKSLFPSMMICLAAYAVMAFGESAPQPSPLAANYSATPNSSIPTPFCQCESCECLNCSCTPVALAPLVVGPPPDLAHSIVSATEPAPVQLVALQNGSVKPEKFTQPAPQVYPTAPLPAVPKPAPKAAAAPQVYYSSGSCANGSCGSGRRGWFGRRR